MIITCKNCHASYNLDESLLDPAGSRVRCTNCGHVFVAYPPPTITVPDDDIDEGVDVTDAEVDETWESPAPETTEFDFEETEKALTEDAPSGARDGDLLEDLDLDLALEETEVLSEAPAEGPDELEFDLEPLDNEGAIVETEVFEAQDIDLGDIDKILQDDEETMASVKEGEPGENPDEAELDASGLETAQIAADLVRTSTSEAEEDLYGEETGIPREPATDEEIAALGNVYTLRTATTADGQTSLTAEPEAIVGREAGAPPPKRRFTWLWVLLVLLGLAGGGAYWAWQQGVDLSFFTRLLEQQPADEAGNLKISTLSIDSRFVENASAGRLFVISGKARNDYDHPRTQIQIKGSLLATGKKLVASDTVFAGNMLTDLDLNLLGIAEIQQRLDRVAEADKSKSRVLPGGLVPFMVVFSNLPSDLEEFTIEVASSSR